MWKFISKLLLVLANDYANIDAWFILLETYEEAFVRLEYLLE